MLNPGSKMGLKTLMGHCHYSDRLGAASRWSSLHLDSISAVDCLKAKVQNTSAGVIRKLYEQKYDIQFLNMLCGLSLKKVKYF